MPIGLAAIALSRTRLPESRGGSEPLDLPALVLLAGGTFGLVWGLVQAGTAGWVGTQTIAALGGGLLLVGGFVGWEQRAVAPMLPLRLFRSRAFTAANVTALLMIAALSGAVFLIAQYCQLVLGYAPLATGLRLLPWTATPLLIAPAAGRVSDRIGRRPVLATGMLLQALGLAWFAALTPGQTGYPEMVPALLVAGIGISMALPTAATAALSAVAPHELGKASGTNSTLQRLGGVLGVAAVTAVFTANGRVATAASFTAGFRPGLLVAAGLSLLGAFTALALPAASARIAAAPTTPPVSDLATASYS